MCLFHFIPEGYVVLKLRFSQTEGMLDIVYRIPIKLKVYELSWWYIEEETMRKNNKILLI